MRKRYTVPELTRLAFLYAEQDREGFAEANPKGSPERALAQEQAKAFRDYRLRKWGQTQLEVDLQHCVLVDVYTGKIVGRR